MGQDTEKDNTPDFFVSIVGGIEEVEGGFRSHCTVLVNNEPVSDLESKEIYLSEAIAKQAIEHLCNEFLNHYRSVFGEPASKELHGNLDLNLNLELH